MAKLKRPENFYVNKFGGVAVLVWDKVVKDIEQNYANVESYYIYKTSNPNGVNWGSPIYILDTKDNFNDTDVFYIDFSSGNELYRICPFDGVELGECAISYGIAHEGEIFVPNPSLWDVALWDKGLWG